METAGFVHSNQERPFLEGYFLPGLFSLNNFLHLSSILFYTLHKENVSEDLKPLKTIWVFSIMDTSPKVELVQDWVPAQCWATKSCVAVQADYKTWVLLLRSLQTSCAYVNVQCLAKCQVGSGGDQRIEMCVKAVYVQ